MSVLIAVAGKSECRPHTPGWCYLCISYQNALRGVTCACSGCINEIRTLINNASFARLRRPQIDATVTLFIPTSQSCSALIFLSRYDLAARSWEYARKDDGMIGDAASDRRTTLTTASHLTPLLDASTSRPCLESISAVRHSTLVSKQDRDLAPLFEAQNMTGRYVRYPLLESVSRCDGLQS